MVTISDFNNLQISAFINDFARVFKDGDIRWATQHGMLTVEDVLNDTRHASCTAMKHKLRSCPDALVSIYNYLNYPCLLPAKVDGSFSTFAMLKQLFVELNELVDSLRAMPFEQNTDGILSRINNVLTVAKLRYVHNLSDAEIVSEIGLTSETCRTHHIKFIEAIESGLENACVNNVKPFLLKFGLSQIFVKRIKEIKSSYESGLPLDILTDKIGSTDMGIVRFFLDLLDADIYSSDNGTFTGTYIVGGFPLTKFDQDCSVLFDMIAKEHEYVIGAKIKTYLSKHFKAGNIAKVEAIMRMADYSGQFNIIEKDGLKYYQLKYKYLKHDDVRNERILFENRGKFLSKAEMENEYNQKARRYGLDEKIGSNYHIRGTNRMVCQNGVWHWIEDGEENISDPRRLIKMFVQGNSGPVSFTEIRKYLTDNNVNLKDSTIRTYLTDFCKHIRKGDVFIVKSSMWSVGRGDIAEDIIRYLRKMSRPVCVSQIAEALGTTFGRIARNIAYHKDVFEVEKIRRRVFVHIKPTFTNEPIEANKRGSRKEPRHKAYMRTMAVDILKNSGGGPLPLKEVADKISTVIANTSFSRTVVYKVFEHDLFVKGIADDCKSAKTVSLNMDVYKRLFETGADYAEKIVADSSVDNNMVPAEYDWNNDYKDLRDAVIAFTKEDPYCKKFDVAKSFDTMNEIMKGDKSSLNKDSYFWLIQELLYKYLTQKTTKVEREFLRDNLAFKYEAFLGNYYYKVNGYKLDESGLANRLRVLQGDGLLPARYSDWSTAYTSSLVKKRNRVHTAVRDLDSTIKSEILKFLVLYLYTASLDSSI